MLPDYVVHSIEGRARLRHTVFLDAKKRASAVRLLSAEACVSDVREGRESLLLTLKSGADMRALCAKLEKKFSELKPAAPSARSADRHCAFASLTPRRLELRVLTGLSLLCLASGFFSSGKTHMAVGLGFALLAGRHIWTRRAAL